jgi:hypothetical protein
MIVHTVINCVWNSHASVSFFKYIFAKARSIFQNTRSSVISASTSVISARRVWFSHARVWFLHARVWFSDNFDTILIILFSITHKSVKSTRTTAHKSYRAACRIDTQMFTVHSPSAIQKQSCYSKWQLNVRWKRFSDILNVPIILIIFRIWFMKKYSASYSLGTIYSNVYVNISFRLYTVYHLHHLFTTPTPKEMWIA